MPSIFTFKIGDFHHDDPKFLQYDYFIQVSLINITNSILEKSLISTDA